MRSSFSHIMMQARQSARCNMALPQGKYQRALYSWFWFSVLRFAFCVSCFVLCISLFRTQVLAITITTITGIAIARY
jgi:hypothetical protein